MKPLLLLLLTAFTATHLFAQSAPATYNKQLADSLGADEYGMKKYVLVLLKTGSNTTATKARTEELFKGHMENIGRLVKEHKLIVAGPLQKNEKTYRGLFILDVPTIEAASALIQTDPAVKEKLFDAELYQWYGSAALPAYLDTHKKIERTSH